jgi:hypothetical protein
MANEQNNPSHLTEDGKIRIRLQSERYAPYPYGQVLDVFGKVIGDAQSYTYGGTAFAVHTRPFAGHVKFSQCVFVGGTRGLLL